MKATSVTNKTIKDFTVRAVLKGDKVEFSIRQLGMAFTLPVSEFSDLIDWERRDYLRQRQSTWLSGEGNDLTDRLADVFRECLNALVPPPTGYRLGVLP